MDKETKRNDFDAYENYETQYTAENIFMGHTPDMYNNFSGTVNGLAEELEEYLITKIESTSFSGETARELAYDFISRVNFSQIADRMIDDNT
jgi:hypothetical protein